MSSAIQKLLATEVVEVYREACKNYRNKTETCRLCVDCCSEEAISLQNQIPTIVDTKCIDCGACVSVCPVSAIDHLKKPYAKITQYVVDFPQAEITCDRVEELNRGIKVPCLFYLDAPLLSQYVGNREDIHIYIGHCHACPKGTEILVSKHLEKLENQLLDLGIVFKIKMKDKFLENSSEQTVNAVSRRDLFKRFSLSNIREILLPTSKTNEEPNLEGDYENLSIQQRMHFKKNLINKLHEIDMGVSKTVQKNESFSFQVNENCNGCNVCERICPTKAIYWETNESVSCLIFNKDLCVDCNKCLACPVNALMKTDDLPEEVEEKQELISMNLVHCQQCGEEFKSPKEDDKTCFFCQVNNKKDPMSFFH